MKSKLLYILIFYFSCMGTLFAQENISMEQRVAQRTFGTSANEIIQEINLDKQGTSQIKKGEKFYRIKTKDINGNKLDTRNWLGKTVVINYWFINCPPCRREIPELNKLVKEYKPDSNIIFFAIGLDAESDIEDFISSKPFYYKLVANGQSLKGSEGIQSYPTNIVIDKTGKVHFITNGYSPSTVENIKKAIEESRNIMATPGT